MVSIVIVSYNTCQLTLNCIRSIYLSLADYEIVVVDNRSTDDTVIKVTHDFPSVRVIVTPVNHSYANAVNIGVHATRHNCIIVCNADIEFIRDSISILCDFLQKNPRVGVCAPQQQYLDGSWQYSFGHLPSVFKTILDIIFYYGFIDSFKRRFFSLLKQFDRPRKVGYADGAVLVLRRSAFIEMGGFDEAFTFYAEEADFCFRLKKAGWEVYFQPKASVMHIRGASSGAEMNLSENALRKLVASKVQFMLKHRSHMSMKWFVLLELLNNRIKQIVCSVLLFFRSTPGLQSKKKMFRMMAQFYKSIHRNLPT